MALLQLSFFPVLCHHTQPLKTASRLLRQNPLLPQKALGHSRPRIHWYSKVSAKTEPWRLRRALFTKATLLGTIWKIQILVIQPFGFRRSFSFFIQQRWEVVCLRHPKRSRFSIRNNLVELWVLLSHSSPKKVQKLPFVSRLKTPFCVQLLRPDSSKILWVRIQAFTLKTPQTNQNKVSSSGYFSNPKCLVGTIAQKDYWSFDHVFQVWTGENYRSTTAWKQ